MTCPALLRFRKVLYVGLTPQEVSFVTSSSVGHRVEIHMPCDILNAYFSWSRPAGSTKPVANFLSNESSLLQTSLDSLPSFSRTLENYLGSVYTDLDPQDGLDFSSSSLDHIGDINRDECIYNKLTDTGLANQDPASGESSTHYSANDLAMAHMLYKCFGSSSYNTDDVYNIDDAFGMITSKELADKITEMLSADQAGGANMINSMFSHLVSLEPLRYVGNETIASALFSNSPSPQDVSGSWGFVRGDKLEFTLRLMYRAPLTTMDSNGNESAPYVVGQAHDYNYEPPSSVSNPAPNAANVINIRLQITCDAAQGNLPSAPSAPRSVSAVPGNGQATVSWTPPADSGGSAITSYTVTSSPGGFTASGSSPLVVLGLTNGTSYTFAVVATNGLGNSAPSLPSSPVTPATIPDAPTSVSATRGNGQANVSWTAPATGGSPITSYTVTSSPGGFTASGSSPLTVTGLTNGTEYTFTVVATNSVGDSLSSASSSVTPATVPDAPTSVSGMFGDNQALVSWTAPNNGGDAITSYTVTSSPGGFSASTSESPVTVSGLSNGTVYTFTVVATNTVGDSAPSSASPGVTPSSAPDAPSNVSATRGNGQASVSWTAPSDEGSPITSYTVISSPGGFTASSASTSATVTGLTNGTAYTFTVYATNMDGNSGISLPSDPVTPATNPDAPTDVSAVAGNAQADVSFTAPSDNGSAITSYTVTSSPDGFTVSGSESPLTITGLNNGTAYTFTVVATNSLGDSAPSSSSSPVTPVIPTAPDAPTDVSAVPGDAQADVTFTAPSNNGGVTITSYTVTSSPGGFTASGSSPVTVTGLNNGTAYTFTVVATNSIGNSASSSASDPVTPSSAPDAPTDVSAVVGNGEATVSWTAPFDEGAAITSYTVTSSPGGFTASSATTSATVTGLTNGTAYTFTVVATNSVGNSAPSVASSAYTPITVSTAPLNVTGVAGTSQVAVSWTAPVSNGGSTITSYTVTSSPGGFTASSATTSATVTGLTGGTAYTFTVVAINSAGGSAASAASSAYTPISLSTPPLNVTGVAGNGQVVVSWTAPVSNGGLSITSYKVTSSPGGFNLTVSYPTTTATITGLTLGTAYTFTVVATNGLGDSAASSASPSYTPFSNGSMNFTSGANILAIPSSGADSDFNLTNTVPFTIEWWQYITSNGSYFRPFAMGRSDSGQPIYIGLIYFSVNATTARIQLQVTGYYNITSSFTVLPSSWQHIAVVGNGGGASSSISVYLNGALLSTQTINYTYTNTAYPLTIGNSSSQDSQFVGRISNFRWVNGTAVYTAPFTPPTSNLTAIPGTKLLLLSQTNATKFTDSGPLNKTPSNTVGTVTWSSSAPF